MKPPKLPVPLEKEEQAAIIRLFEAVGTIVCRLSQSRASRQTEGLPDLYCFHPGKRVAWWWETKRQKGGKVSPSQEFFRDLHETPHQIAVPYALSGALRDAERWLTCSPLMLAVFKPNGLISKTQIADRGIFTLLPMCTPAFFTWRGIQLAQRSKGRLARRRRTR